MAAWFYPAVYAWVVAVPAGRVVTYGQVAACLGYPRYARAVGAAMAICMGRIPWQRVGSLTPALSPDPLKMSSPETPEQRSGPEQSKT